MVKLIVSDMDGTLLDDNKILHDDFWEIFEELKKRGIYFVPASGRQYYNIYEYFKRIKEGLIILAENGSFILEDGKELYSKCLDKKDALELIEAGRKIPSANLIFCGKKKAYVESSLPEFIAEVEKYYTKYEIVPDITKVDDEALKVTICDLTGAEKNSYPYFEKYKKDFKVAVSGFVWVDITHIDSNKGTGLRVLQEKLGISKDETMVFGDYLNDWELMQQGKYNFAMENAHPKLKEIAGYNGGDNNDSGVVKNIKKYVIDGNL